MLVHSSVFDHALREFQTNKAKLYRSDGSPVYGDKELGERVSQLLERPKIALNALEKESAAAIAEAERDLQLADLDPVLQLSDAELNRAAALRGFVADAVSEADLPTLAKMLQAVEAHGGKAERTVYLRAATAKVEAFRAERRDGGNWSDAAGIGDCTEAITRLRDSLADPKRSEKLSSARSRIQEARTALQDAKVKMGQLDGSTAKAQERVNGMYQSIL